MQISWLLAGGLSACMVHGYGAQSLAIAEGEAGSERVVVQWW